MEHRKHIAQLMMSLGVIVIALNGGIRRPPDASKWAPFWKVGFSRRRMVLHLLGAAIAVAGTVLLILGY